MYNCNNEINEIAIDLGNGEFLKKCSYFYLTKCLIVFKNIFKIID